MEQKKWAEKCGEVSRFVIRIVRNWNTPNIKISFLDHIRRQMMSFSTGTISQHQRQAPRSIGSTSLSYTRPIWQGYIVPKRQMIFHVDGMTSLATMPWKTWEKCTGLRKTKNYQNVKVISEACMSNSNYWQVGRIYYFWTKIKFFNWFVMFW